MNQILNHVSNKGHADPYLQLESVKTEFNLLRLRCYKLVLKGCFNASGSYLI